MLFYAQVSRTPSFGARKVLIRGTMTFLTIAVLCDPARAAVFNIADADVAGLIAAINVANANGEADVINLAAGGSYFLDSTLPTISTQITINGNGATLRPNTLGKRFLFVHQAQNVAINDLFCYAAVQTSQASFGGALAVISSSATLTRCIFDGNRTTAAAAHGGAVAAVAEIGASVSLTIDQCHFQSNYALQDADGGALYVSGHLGSASVLITHSTFDDNLAGNGGAVLIASASGELRNCTISGNTAGVVGGGIYISSDNFTLTNCTITDNFSLQEGGGLFAYYGAKLSHTLIGLNNSDRSDFRDVATAISSNHLQSNGRNLIGHKSSFTALDCLPGAAPCLDILETDPKLKPLASNGGFAPTHSLHCDSPAIDAGFATNCPTATDQRGMLRGVDGNRDGVRGCDIGAFETQISDITDADGDGVDDVCDSCPGTPAATPVDSSGCPLPPGACCLPNGFCQETTQAACGWVGGLWQGSGTTCATANCPAAPTGSVRAWGRNQWGQLNVPAPNDSFVGISGGADHSLGLKASGAVVAWGRPNEGQLNVPAPNANFIQVEAGNRFSLGLKSDGSVVGWGYGLDGQLTPPAPNSGFVAIAAGAFHSVGLRSTGAIAAWGDNSFGECDVPVPNTDFVAIAAGAQFSAGLKSDGSIVAWGDNSQGQLVPPAANSAFTAIAAGWFHGLGRKTDGSIVGWGYSAYGQLDVPAPNSGFAAFGGGGEEHSLGLKSDGTVAAWGLNTYGQLNVSAPNADYVALAAGQHYSLGIQLPTGACCLPTGACSSLTQPGCAGAGGTWQGAGVACGADSDGDGVVDVCDGCPNDPNKIAPGLCGCGVPDTDSDADATPDCSDGCPNDPSKTAPGICGCGVADTDSDGDGVADCHDICPGGDDHLDCNGNQIPDACEVFSPPGSTAIRLDGIDDHVNTGPLTLTAPFTIEAWVRPDTIAGVMRIISNRGCPSGIGVGSFNGRLRFTAFGVQDYNTAGTYLTIGQWRHVAVVFDAGYDAHFYVDGNLVQTVPDSAPPIGSSRDLLIGRNPCESEAAEPWNGQIDEVRIWTTARTAQQIAYGVLAVPAAGTPNLAGFWRFEENTGATTADSSGNGHTGTLVNGAAWSSIASALDCNGNHIPDTCDSDTDGDGVPDVCDNCPNDPIKTQPGACGCGVPEGTCEVTISAWRSVRTHGVAGPQSILLDAAATGNGISGPTVECRNGGIQRIEIDFSSAITLANTGLITVSGRTTSYPGGVPGGPVSYTPSSVTLSGAATMVLTFPAAPSPGFLPDLTCYTIIIPAGAIGQILTGDNDLIIRALEGDATGSGDVTLSDAILTTLNAGQPVASHARFDMNLDGAVSVAGDALFAKARVASPSRKALCL